MDHDEAVLHARLIDALDEIPGVEVEVDRETVVLRGKVADVAEVARAEELASAVDGVDSVVNRLVVGT